MNETYTLEVLAEMTGISSRTLVEYQQHGIIQPQFDDDTVRCLRRIEHVREACGMNLGGLKLMARLLQEIDELRHELRLLR